MTFSSPSMPAPCLWRNPSACEVLAKGKPLLVSTVLPLRRRNAGHPAFRELSTGTGSGPKLPLAPQTRRHWPTSRTLPEEPQDRLTQTTTERQKRPYARSSVASKEKSTCRDSRHQVQANYRVPRERLSRR